MTAQPTNTQFFASQTTRSGPHMVRPVVDETYWGYVVSPNIRTLHVAVVLRGVAAGLALFSIAASVGIWAMPNSAFSGDPAVIKAMGAILMTCVAALLLRYVGRSTVVRVQIDTSAGEIRQVVRGILGGDVVLARYGMDSVQMVDVMPSTFDPAYGQVQIALKGAGKIAAGEGAVVVLKSLANRMASDFGLDRSSAPL